MTIKHNPQAALLITENIATLEPFAQEICTRLRKLITVNFPELIEDWKWGPHYYYEGMVCGFWGFKKHASLVFFNGSLLKDTKKLLKQNGNSLNTRHLQYKSINDLDDKIVIAYVKEAIALNKKGVKRLKPSPEDKVVVVDPEFKKALTKSKLLVNFNALTYYKRKELTTWINDAKRDETKKKRILKSIQIIEEGGDVMNKK